MNASDKSLVEALKRSKVYREYERAFRGAIGLPITFTPAETWGLPLHEDPAENPFCRLMARNNKACAACLELQARLGQRPSNEACTEQCFCGLCDSAVPVRLGDRLIGYLRTGQVFVSPPNETGFQQTVAKLTSWGVPVNEDELRAAYFAGKVVTAEQHRAILRLLKLFAEQLGALSNQILVSESTAENPQITRAREFIAQNMTEDITLADCARTSHMSRFYFCKMFKRATGLSFTDYLSRLRIEKARDRLVDPNARVSEVAFDVGFQSLSQFNRAFKKVTGQSPTEYRRSLRPSIVARVGPGGRAGAAEIPSRRFKLGAVRRPGPAIRPVRSLAAR